MSSVSKPDDRTASSIRELVTRLEVVVEAEEETYRRFKQVLRREEDELITLDPRDLERTTAEKEALGAEARLHGESRVELTRALASVLGETPAEARLSELLPKLGDVANGLVDRQARLRALMDSTRALLAANEDFANRTLGRVQDTLRMLGQAIPEAEGYGPGRSSESSAGRGRLVRAAI
ncbi:MAG: flagellar protein FlgN [bacterium]|nr:flagellar protein FlgN [bacterium]